MLAINRYIAMIAGLIHIPGRQGTWPNSSPHWAENKQGGGNIQFRHFGTIKAKVIKSLV